MKSHRTVCFAVLLCAPLLVVGCGRTPTTPADLPQGHADAEGNVLAPEGFPADAPRFPGARVEGSSRIYPAVSILLETPEPEDRVAAWYSERLPAGGWAVEQRKE